MVNAAVERMPGDLAVARIVERSWDTVQLALTMALSRARAQGELPPDRDPAALARFLLAVLQGLRVLAKGPSPEQRLRDAATMALSVLT